MKSTIIVIKRTETEKYQHANATTMTAKITTIGRVEVFDGRMTHNIVYVIHTLVAIYLIQLTELS